MISIPRLPAVSRAVRCSLRGLHPLYREAGRCQGLVQGVRKEGVIPRGLAASLANVVAVEPMAKVTLPGERY